MRKFSLAQTKRAVQSLFGDSRKKKRVQKLQKNLLPSDSYRAGVEIFCRLILQYTGEIYLSLQQKDYDHARAAMKALEQQRGFLAAAIEQMEEADK